MYTSFYMNGTVSYNQGVLNNFIFYYMLALSLLSNQYVPDHTGIMHIDRFFHFSLYALYGFPSFLLWLLMRDNHTHVCLYYFLLICLFKIFQMFTFFICIIWICLCSLNVFHQTDKVLQWICSVFSETIIMALKIILIHKNHIIHI